MDAIGSVAFSMTIRQACFVWEASKIWRLVFWTRCTREWTDQPMNCTWIKRQCKPHLRFSSPFPLTTSGVWCFHGFPETKVGCKAGGLCGHRSLPLYFAGVTRCPVILGCFSPVTRWCFSLHQTTGISGIDCWLPSCESIWGYTLED